MMAAHRFKERFAGEDDPEKERLAREVQDCKEEAEQVSRSVSFTWHTLMSGRTTLSRFSHKRDPERWDFGVSSSSFAVYRFL